MSTRSSTSKKIPELNAITYRPGEGLTIGAAVPCHRIVEHADIVKMYPGLVDAVALIGGTAIKGRATMGGNLCNAAPSGDSIPAMIVLGATCHIAGPAGMRTVPVELFCTGPGKTVLGRDELLVSVHFPAASSSLRGLLSSLYSASRDGHRRGGGRGFGGAERRP